MHYERQNPDQVVSEAGDSSPQDYHSLALAARKQSPSLLGPMLAIPQNEIFLNYTRTHLFRHLDEDDRKVHHMPELGHHLGGASMLALATIFFGTEHQDRAVIQRGLQKYSGVIQEINATLGDAVRCQSSDLFDAIGTMVLLEVSRYDYHLCSKHLLTLDFSPVSYF